MKGMHLLGLLATAIIAVPINEHEQQFEPAGLHFGRDGRFQITVFEDLHFGEESWGRDCPECLSYDAKTTQVMESVLDKEVTNLAVLNGDLLSAEAVSSDNYTKYIDRIVAPLVSRDIPWASTYGNHDRDVNSSPSEILKKEESYNTFGDRRTWTRSMVPGDDAKVGSSNYYIPIYSSRGDNLVMMLWFFDSRGGGTFGKKGKMEDFVTPDVVSWYQAQQTSLKTTHKRVIPSLAFVHIPFRASSDLQKQRHPNPSIAPGINGELIGHQANTCDATGKTCYPSNADTAFTQALVNTEGLMAVFSGHNHNVDWCMKWAGGKGLNVCFGRRTGYGGYDKKYKKGARKIVVHEDGVEKKELDTWIRLEDGSISGSITLNSTYGMDKYPATPEQRGAGKGAEEGTSS